MLLKVVPEFDLDVFLHQGAGQNSLNSFSQTGVEPNCPNHVLMLGEVPRRIKQSA